MTFVAVSDRAQGRADSGAAAGEGGKARTRAPARTRGSVSTGWAAVTDRVREARSARPRARLEDGSPDGVRGVSPWHDGAASPAAVLAYTRAGDWVPGEQDVWLERAGKLYGYLALLVTVAVTFPLWVVQRPSRAALALVLGSLLFVTFACTGDAAGKDAIAGVAK